MSVHADENVVMRVYAHAATIIDKLELAGPWVNDPRYVKKLTSHNGLGEGRYRDATGAYRFFFKFGRLNGERVVLFADGDRKTSDDFRPARYRRAEQAVDAAFDEFGVVHADEW